jgi:hypothetical protein
MKRLVITLLMLALPPACGDGPAKMTGAPKDTGDDTGKSTDLEDAGVDAGDPASLEIAGTYTTEWGQTITVSATEWKDESEAGTFTYTIASYDNEKNYLVAQDNGDDKWDRFEWTLSSDTLHYCQTIFDAETEADADVAESLADVDDINEGCGGFSWSSLTPAG